VESEWITTSTILWGLRDFEDRGAWQRFVERFRAPIVRLAQAQGLDVVDAEDVAQETLLAFADGYRAGRYDIEKGRLSRWLFGIAFRQVLRSREARARRALIADKGERLADALDAIPDQDAATRTWDVEWERAILAQCLTQLRREVEPQTFRAFERTALDNVDAASAAAELGIDVKAVYNAKHRALKRVRELRESMEQLTG
jgi:RNA polymerase sigma factor (sigma-70 family)